MAQSRFSGPIKITGVKGGLQYTQANAATPTSTTIPELYRSGTDLYWWNGTTASKVNAQSVGGGGSTSLDGAYENGRTVGLDLGAIVLNDATSGSANSIELNLSGAKSGDGLHVVASAAVTGNLIDLALNAAVTGNAIDLDMDQGVAAKGIYIDNGAGARTGADFNVKSDSTAAHSVIDIDASGSGASIGFDWQGSYNGSPAGHVFKVTFDAADNLDTELMQVDTGSGNRGIMFDLNFAHTDSGTTSHIFDIDVTGLLDSNVLDIEFGTAASTGDAIKVVMGTNLAGSAIVLTGTGSRTDDLIQIDDDSTGSGHIFDINLTGIYAGNVLDISFATAAATGDAIKVDLGTGLAASALVVVATGARTDDLVKVDDDSTSNSHVFDINMTGAATGNVLDISFATGAYAGDAIVVALGTGVAASALVVTGTGVRTDDIFKVDTDDTGAAHVFDINMTGAGSGNVLDITYATAANTGHAIAIATGTNLAGNAMLITTAGARTAPVIYINGVGTDAGTDDHVIFINQTGALDSNMIQLTYATGVSTGDCIGISMGTNLAGSALAILGTGSRTDDLIKIDDDSTGNSHIFDINMTGVYTGNIIDISFATAAATGDALVVDMGTAVAGSAIVLAGAGNRTDDLIKIDDTSAGNSHTFDINFSGIYTGNCLDITYATAAATGNAIDLNMGTNVAGDAINISSAGTGDGCILDVAHSGDLASGSGAVKIVSTGNFAGADGNLVELVQTTGAGQAGNNVLYIDAQGTNVEAIEIANGLFFEAAVTATPGAGNDETLPTSANVIFYDPNGASRTGVILTAGLRDGQRVAVVNIADAAETITFAAAATSNVAEGASGVIQRYEHTTFIWNTATLLWYSSGE